jgi:hypothetical protein
MLEITLTDSNFPHQEYLTPYLKSKHIVWKRDDIRRKINVYTDNFIKQSVIDIPQDGNINVCILLEPYTNPPWTDIYDYIRTDFEKFDLIITHNLMKLGDLIESRPDKFYYSTKCITTTWLEEKFIGLNNKTKMISMPFSFKNFSEGHRIRHIIYDKYKDSGVIDFYGSGIEGYNGEFRESLVDYKYSICCENCLQKGFNSEKLNDCFLTYTIPIYWGSEIYDENYDKSSVFMFSPNKEKVDFNFEESFENLDKTIQTILATDPYDELKKAVEHNFSYTFNNLQTEDNIYNVLLKRNYI